MLNILILNNMGVIYIYRFMRRKILLDPPFLWMDLVHERWWCLVYQFKWKVWISSRLPKLAKILVVS